MKKLTLTLLSIILTISAAYPRQQQLHEVAFEKAHAKPLIKAELNGKKAYFLLDTGSDISILNEKDSKRFDFGFFHSDNGMQRVNGVGNTSHAIKKAYKTCFSLEGQELTTNFYVYDLQSVVRSLYSKTGVRIAGIIGADIMKKYKFRIYFGDKMAVFETNAKKLTKKDQLHVAKK